MHKGLEGYECYRTGDKKPKIAFVELKAIESVPQQAMAYLDCR